MSNYLSRRPRVRSTKAPTKPEEFKFIMDNNVPEAKQRRPQTSSPSNVINITNELKTTK